MDIYGQALLDFCNNTAAHTLWVNNSYGEPEEMPVAVFFRDLGEMPDLELAALKACKGKVLDIGAGAGSHTLVLQQNGFDVTALELSSSASQIMQLRGVRKLENTDIFLYEKDKFDTLLLLMNGIGLCGTLDGLKRFLAHAKSLLNPGGQLIFDSSDISYLYEDGTPKPKGYFGEVEFQYEYKGQKGEWFKWLYADLDTLKEITAEAGWRCDLLFEDEYDQFLVSLKPSF